MANGGSNVFFYGFRFVNGPLLQHLQSVPARARDADRLSDLFDRLSDWPDRAWPGRALGALLALQEHLVRQPGQRRWRKRFAATAPPCRGSRRRRARPLPPRGGGIRHSDRQRLLGRGRDAAAIRHAARPAKALAAMDAPPLAPTDQAETAESVQGEIRSRRGRRHRDHRGAPRAPCLCGTQGEADPAAAASLSLPMLIVALAAILLGRAAMARARWCGIFRKPLRCSRCWGCRSICAA